MLNAQNELDALRYSYTDQGGTPRSSAMGGAFGALGADVSSMYVNPAGLGLYRRVELQFALGNEINMAEATHYGQRTETELYNFNLSSMGAVFTSKKEEDSPWKNTNFGVAYARTASYATDLNALGYNPDNSLLMQFAEDARGIAPENLAAFYPFGSSLAWETYTIDPLDTGNHTYIALYPDGQVNQSFNAESRGRMSETAFSFAGNYEHKLYVGGTVAFVSARFEENYILQEEREGQLSDLVRFAYEQDLLTTGSGVNFRLGAIYRLNKTLRIGATVQSPSIMYMNDNWTTHMRSRFSDGTSFEYDSPIGEFAWRLNTPWRYTLSAAVVIGKRGLLSIDYEFMNSKGAKLKNSRANINDYDFRLENQRIDDLFTNSNQLRVGTEWKVRKLVLRGGFNIRQHPFKEEYSSNTEQTLGFSGGLGYRVRKFSIDLTFRRQQTHQDRYLYSPDLILPTATTIIRNEVMLGGTFRY